MPHDPLPVEYPIGVQSITVLSVVVGDASDESALVAVAL